MVRRLASQAFRLSRASLELRRCEAAPSGCPITLVREYSERLAGPRVASVVRDPDPLPLHRRRVAQRPLRVRARRRLRGVRPARDSSAYTSAVRRATSAQSKRSTCSRASATSCGARGVVGQHPLERSPAAPPCRARGTAARRCRRRARPRAGRRCRRRRTGSRTPSPRARRARTARRSRARCRGPRPGTASAACRRRPSRGTCPCAAGPAAAPGAAARPRRCRCRRPRSGRRRGARITGASASSARWKPFS